MNRRLERLHAQRDKIKERHGGKSAYIARDMHYSKDSISFGWMMLDYVTGIGGAPRNHQIEVFGVNDVGKTSGVGIPLLVQAQRMGLLVAYVALEPSFEPAWAERHGLDLDRCLILYPDDGPEAFEMTHDLVTGKDTGGEPVIDYVLFDSIGAVNRKEEAVKGLPSAYGASQLITAATRANLMPCFKNNVGVAYINQVRVDTNSNMAFEVYDSPGGEALKHNVMQRVYVSHGGNKEYAKIGGVDTHIGGTVNARMKRNKLAEGSGQKAHADFYWKQMADKPYGIDATKDVIDTALLAGVFEKTGSWYHHPSFPKDRKGEHKLNGAPAVSTHFREHSESVAAVREDVMAVMYQNVAEFEATKRKKNEGQPNG